MASVSGCLASEDRAFVVIAGFVEDIACSLRSHGFEEKENLRKTLLAIRDPQGKRLSNRLLSRLQTVNQAFKVLRHLSQLPKLRADLNQELAALSDGIANDFRAHAMDDNDEKDMELCLPVPSLEELEHAAMAEADALARVEALCAKFPCLEGLAAGAAGAAGPASYIKDPAAGAADAAGAVPSIMDYAAGAADAVPRIVDHAAGAADAAVPSIKDYTAGGAYAAVPIIKDHAAGAADAAVPCIKDHAAGGAYTAVPSIKDFAAGGAYAAVPSIKDHAAGAVDAAVPCIKDLAAGGAFAAVPSIKDYAAGGAYAAVPSIKDHAAGAAGAAVPCIKDHAAGGAFAAVPSIKDYAASELQDKFFGIFGIFGKEYFERLTAEVLEANAVNLEELFKSRGMKK